jgi:glucuronoarabinoxylan endo-1,4-beta-xylanase
MRQRKELMFTIHLPVKLRMKPVIWGAWVAVGLFIPATPGASQTCTVDWNDVHQRIDGFGGGVVFLNPASLDPVTDANMDTLYGTNNATQLGLTLLRVRIDPTTNWNNALLDGQKAVARGAGVLATPWTPPASMKDNGILTNGSLLPAHYANYANYLKNFAGYMSSNGAPLRAISVQNEPDWPATYESCLWSPAQFLNFFRTNAPGIGSTPVMMPESLGYNFSYSDPTLNDPVAVTHVDLIGGHLYGVNAIVDYPNAHHQGKPTWMTEFLVNTQTISGAIITAQQIHDCLTVGNMSAYIWWKCLGDANGLVNASGVPQKRGFVMAQFSRFVHANYFRIGVSGNIDTGTNASISAYRDPNGTGFALVAINTNVSATINQTFNLTNFITGSVTPWITSSAMSLAVQSPVTVTHSSFAYLLPALSIVTFTGQGHAITNPVIRSVAVAGGKVNLAISGPQGPDYTLLTTTNLMAGWQLSSTTNSPLMPMTLTDTNVADPARFYRIQIGP